MAASLPQGNRSRKGPSACSGCSLCVPVCPVWRSARDLRMSPEGRMRALQHGATIAELADSVEACAFCGACEAVCPEDIDLLGVIRELRAELPDSMGRGTLRQRLHETNVRHPPAATGKTWLIPGAALRSRPSLLDTAAHLLGARIAADIADDISLAIETGLIVPPEALEHFLAPLRAAKRIVVADGTLRTQLRTWLPGVAVVSLGEQLSTRPAIRKLLRPGDMYLIDARLYHADYERLVMHYHRLREERGIHLNLDLQRLAIPASVASLRQRLGEMPADDAEHVSWILKGRQVSRVIAERIEDQEAFARHSDIPVMHITELAGVAGA
jgi:ferredoxin